MGRALLIRLLILVLALGCTAEDCSPDEYENTPAPIRSTKDGG
jgi:hypothetical protein